MQSHQYHQHTRMAAEVTVSAAAPAVDWSVTSVPSTLHFCHFSSSPSFVGLMCAGGRDGHGCRKTCNTSKCVNRFATDESKCRHRCSGAPSRRSRSTNVFSSRRIHGRRSSCTWYGVTCTWICMARRVSVSSRLRDVIHVFLAPPCPPSSQYISLMRDSSRIMVKSSGVSVFR